MLSLVIVIAISSIAQKKDSSAPLKYQSEYFELFYSATDTAHIVQMAVFLDSNFKRVLLDLKPVRNPGSIKVFLYYDISLLRKVMELPKENTWGVGGVVSADTILIMSPYSRYIKGNYSDVAGRSIILHEAVHCICMLINPSIVNNPNWVWEGIAGFEANQLPDLKNKDYILHHQIPSFEELKKISNYTKNYELGYSYVEYVKYKWGPDAVIQLLLRNGDIKRILGIPEKEFLPGWYSYISEKYLKPDM